MGFCLPAAGFHLLLAHALQGRLERGGSQKLALGRTAGRQQGNSKNQVSFRVTQTPLIQAFRTLVVLSHPVAAWGALRVWLHGSPV